MHIYMAMAYRNAGGRRWLDKELCFTYAGLTVSLTHGLPKWHHLWLSYAILCFSFKHLNINPLEQIRESFCFSSPGRCSLSSSLLEPFFSYQVGCMGTGIRAVGLMGEASQGVVYWFTGLLWPIVANDVISSNRNSLEDLKSLSRAVVPSGEEPLPYLY